MHEFFTALTGPSGKDLSIVLVFLVVGVTLIAIFGFIQWRKIEQRRMEAGLKQEMLQRGMSADEIVRVIEASYIKTKWIDTQKGGPPATYTSAD